MTTTAADLEGLPLAGKLRLVTELWEQIASSQSPPLSKRIVEHAVHRTYEMIADPSIGIDE